MPSPFIPLPGTGINEMDTPCLCIDLPVFERNLKKMAAFLRERGVACRPHAKTSKCPAICLKQIDGGAIGVCASKVGSAEALVAGGVRNILVTNEIVGPTKIARLIALCRSADMLVVVDAPANVADLSDAARRSGVELGVVVEVNVRLNRCGVAPGAPAVELANIVADSPGLRFAGLMGYEGTIRLLDIEQRTRETRQAIDKLLMTKEAVERAGLPVEIVSAGGTSTWNITSTFPGVTEIQPGNYIFMDGTAVEHTPDFETALFLLTTVISRQPAGKAICDVGLTALTANGSMPVVQWPAGAKLVKLDQEHGHLSLDGEAERLRVGDKVAILPSHGETTINLHDYYFGLRAGVLESVFEISGRGRFR